jgi:hypothetical protein
MNLIEMKAEQGSKCLSASKPAKTFDRPGQTEEGWWDAITEKFIPWDDSINTNHTTDSCEGCPTKKMLSQGITYIGDLPCEWCNKNPYRITCTTEVK